MNPLVSSWLRTEIPKSIRNWVALVGLEVLLLIAYFALTPDYPTDEIRYLVYPFLWINAGLWAVSRAEPNPPNRALRLLAAAIAGAYLLLILYIPGNVGIGGAGIPVDLRIEMYAPGWGPLVAFTSPWLRLFLLPFEVVGYGGLAYLVYVNLLDMTRGVLSGAFGLVTCIGCTVPVLVPLAGILGGPAASLTTTAYAWSYDVGTLFFLLTVGLLSWSHRQTRR